MENFWVQLADMARSRGGRAVVAFPEVKGLSERLANAPIDVVELPVPGDGIPDLIRLRSLLKDRSVTTVYLTDRLFYSPFYMLLRSWGVRSIIIHDHMPGEWQKTRGLRRIAKSTIHNVKVFSADLYIGVSEFVYRRFHDSACIPQDRCTFVHNGIPSTERGRGDDIRQVFGLPADAQVVVSCGRASPYKRIDFIIECAAEILRRGRFSNVHFVHLGGGPELESYRSAVRDRGLEDHVHLVGRRDDVRSLLASCDLALHASKGEAFSLAILEFMEAGLPVVAPDHCGNDEAVRDGTDGILYPPGSRDKAVQWVGRLLTDREWAEILGRNGRNRVRERFTLEEMNGRFRDVVREALILPSAGENSIHREEHGQQGRRSLGRVK